MACRGLLTRLKKLFPAADHPAAHQPRPYGLNRYIILTVYLGYTILSTFVYLGWGSLSTMLFRNKTFLWECTPEEQAAATNFELAVCKKQDVSVQTLFTITYATHFCITAVAGFITDTAGPKVTALLGQTLNICGWGLLGTCSESFRSALPSFLLIGAGAGMSYLPMLCVVHMFPGSTGFLLTLMGAGCSLGSVVLLLLNEANRAGVSYRWVFWGYVFIGPVLSMVVVALFVPLYGFIEVDRFVLVQQMVSVGSAPSRISQRRTKTGVPPLSSSPYGSLSPRIQPPDDPEAPLSITTDEDFLQPFKKEACTFLYIGLCIYFAICSIVLNYYQKAANLFLSPRASRAVNGAIPLSIIFCIILGRLSDYTLIVWIIMFINASGSLSYLLAAVQGETLGMESVVFFFIYISLFSSQVYIFVINLFSSIHFGKLAGIVNMLGGITSLVSNFLYNSLTMERNDGDPSPVLWGLFGLTCFAFVILVPMAFAAKRKLRTIELNQVLKEVNTNSGSAGLKNFILQSPSTVSRIRTVSKIRSVSKIQSHSMSASIRPQQVFTPHPTLGQSSSNPKTKGSPSPKEPSASPESEDRLSISLPDFS